jgi:SOS response regulatory protein OraA/RecX
MSKTIPGPLVWPALAESAKQAELAKAAEGAFTGDTATMHAPTDRYGYRKAARDMVARGYSTRDTAHALRLTVTGVLELLAETEPVDGGQLKRWAK